MGPKKYSIPCFHMFYGTLSDFQPESYALMDPLYDNILQHWWTIIEDTDSLISM